MSSYDKIKDLIEKKKLSEGLLLALSNSLKIKLTTKQQVSKIETDIDLLKGLNTHINDKNLLSKDNYALNFHQKQLENIYQTWDKNRETLVTIFKIISGSSVDINFISVEHEKFSETDDNFDDNFNDFEEESSIENSFTIDEEDKDNINDDVSENWIDDLNNDVEDSFSQKEELENVSEEVSLEVASEEEEEIFNSEGEDISMEEESVEDENWGDLMGEMSEEEALVSEEIIMDNENEDVSPDLETDDDWEEWLDEDNLPNHNGEYNPEAIDWSEENWQEEEEAS
ncbi:hypothetical protein [Geminocystis sp. NIES-3709]|uniref:hypothetical protein n=1 Tax=Geminocystis sp. NIES-3709 TaxID=1617448 RepID=UPI0005FCDBB9|nr:hypothetical protein [Geminocystis sp. NIES-3709]BAQ64092.1 topoisomerase IV subunit A [Geminocystis sp. NIES-3709]